jgi:hypothetical protein
MSNLLHKEAKQIVDMFYKAIKGEDNINTYYKAQQCAIHYVDGLFQESQDYIDSKAKWYDINKKEITTNLERCKHWTDIKNEILKM